MVITDDPLKVLDSRELLSRACAGDADAFCRLSEPLQTRLLRQAVALTGDANSADDLVSETLVEAWKSLPRYNQSCRLSTWLYAILLNRHRKSVRHARRRLVSLAWLPFHQAQEFDRQQANLPSSELSPTDKLLQSENIARLQRCLEMLPDKHRQIILLRFFEDASLSDMAAVLGCSIGTVKSRLHNALEKLRKMKMNLPELKGDKQL